MSSLNGSDAWEYYLRTISHFYRFTKSDNARAREMAEKICELHPDKMLGPAYVAMMHWLDASRGWSESRERSIALAAEWAERSTASEELNNGLGYVILGSVRLLERHHDEALALCRRGIGYRANCPFALGQLAAVENYCGDARSAVKTAREALTVRMVYPPPLVDVLAMAYRDASDIGSSIPAAREAARLDPMHTDAHVTLCSDYALAGDCDEARRTADRILDIDPGFTISAYTEKQPYRDAARLSQIADALRTTGLPE
jgi:tetratricopeptide (TPR) repeat protein